MKPWATPIINLLLGETQYVFAHLYVITLASGVKDYFTDFDMDITYNNITYKSNSLRIEGMRFKISVGTQVDEQDIKIFALPGDTLAGSNFLASVPQGLLDGAWVDRSRIFWPLVTGSAWYDVVHPWTGWPQAGELSYMRVSTITKIGRSHIELKLKSPLVLLNIPIPHRYYQLQCQWILYQTLDGDGAGCGMLKQNFGVAYQVGAGVTFITVPAALQSGGYTYGGFTYPQDPGGAAGIQASFRNGVLGTPTGVTVAGQSYDLNPTFMHGRMLFATGKLVGQQFLINSNDAVNFTVAYPFNLTPAVGDVFIAYPGCLNTVAACSLKFGTGATGGNYVAVAQAQATALGQPAPNFGGNMQNFGGYDQVPPEHYGL